MEFAQATVHRPVRLQEIAAAAGLSVRHCTRLFKEHTGLSPIQFCIQQRMAMAENLVINTSEPFKQVAMSLGYEDALNFSVQFKQHFKMSPRHYREKARGR
ncbi:MAG: AraC family transcriptional regulator [bacterium]